MQDIRSPPAGVKFTSKGEPGQFKQRPVHNGIENSRARGCGTRLLALLDEFHDDVPGSIVISERNASPLLSTEILFSKSFCEKLINNGIFLESRTRISNMRHESRFYTYKFKEV